MIVRIEPRFKTFNDYFLEADDDESNSTTSSTITIKPHRSRGTDYSSIAPEEEDNTPPEDDGDDYTATPKDNDGGGEDAAVLDDDNDDGTDYTDTSSTDDDSGDGGGDNTDTNEDNQDDSGEDQQDDSNASDASKKYYLFKKFSNLYNHLLRYVEALQSTTYDNIYYNNVVKSVISRLQELKKCIYEYMIVKFDSVTYLEGCIYYETVYNLLAMSLELLKTNKQKAQQLNK
jgi:hypothetical protein